MRLFNHVVKFNAVTPNCIKRTSLPFTTSLDATIWLRFELNQVPARHQRLQAALSDKFVGFKNKL